MVHVGVDLHKQFSQVAVLTDEGEIREGRVENEREAMVEYFRGLPPSRVAIEASGTWWWLVDLLEELGHEAVLSHPKQTKAIASARLKNDRVDAERLALLSRGDLLPTVWIPSASIREARELFRHRVGLVWQRTVLRNRLTSLLARRNLRRKSGSSWFTKVGLAEMRALELPASARAIRDDLLALLDALNERIQSVETELVDRWGQDPRVRRLMTIPGIGGVTAMGLVIEIGNIDRFPSTKHLASYVGLTPRVRASAGRVRTGHISKEGNRLVRWLAVAAATQAVRRAGRFKALYGRLARRRGKKVARVAVARNLIGVVYHVWKDQIDYAEFLRRSACGG